MSATNIPSGGNYLLQFGLEFNSPNPGPWYLTSHGEGKQLTIEHQNNHQNQVVSITIYVPCTYSLTCFCFAVDYQLDTGGKTWLAIPYNCTSFLTGDPSCLPGCRSIPWPSFSHQEPAGLEFSTDSSIGVCLWVSFLMSSANFSNLITRIVSNLYVGLVGAIPLLGVDLESKDLNVKTLVNITRNDELLIFILSRP